MHELLQFFLTAKQDQILALFFTILACGIFGSMIIYWTFNGIAKVIHGFPKEGEDN